MVPVLRRVPPRVGALARGPRRLLHRGGWCASLAACACRGADVEGGYSESRSVSCEQHRQITAVHPCFTRRLTRALGQPWLRAACSSSSSSSAEPARSSFGGLESVASPILASSNKRPHGMPLVVVCGRPRTGKSTFARALAAHLAACGHDATLLDDAALGVADRAAAFACACCDGGWWRRRGVGRLVAPRVPANARRAPTVLRLCASHPRPRVCVQRPRRRSPAGRRSSRPSSAC